MPNENVFTATNHKIKEVYNTFDNYEIQIYSETSNLCLIYFSSHAIYSSVEKDFDENIIDKNRYEWRNNILKSAGKVIFLRDVHKNWYLQGVNCRINSIERLYEFLRIHTKGFDVVCVGGSAGGYAAVLMGCLLDAKVFCFSGQFSLWPFVRDSARQRTNPFLVASELNSEITQYYSLIPYISGSKISIFYFYPALCDLDIEQSRYISSMQNVYAFPFARENHGIPCYKVNLLDLISMPTERLIYLSDFWRGKVISPFDFSVKVSGLGETLAYLMGHHSKRKTLSPKS